MILKEWWQNYKHGYSLRRLRTHLDDIGVNASIISDSKLEEMATRKGGSLAGATVVLGRLAKMVKRHNEELE